MTVREDKPPVGLRRGGLLLFDDVDHPRHTVLVGDFTETVRPECFLPVHFDLTCCCQVVKPALPFVDILRVEDQRESGVMGFSRRDAVAHHDVAARNTQVGVGDGGIGEFHSRRATLFTVLRRLGHFTEVDFVEQFCAQRLLLVRNGVSAVACKRDVGT